MKQTLETPPNDILWNIAQFLDIKDIENLMKANITDNGIFEYTLEQKKREKRDEICKIKYLAIHSDEWLFEIRHGAREGDFETNNEFWSEGGITSSEGIFETWVKPTGHRDYFDNVNREYNKYIEKCKMLKYDAPITFKYSRQIGWYVE